MRRSRAHQTSRTHVTAAVLDCTKSSEVGATWCTKARTTDAASEVRVMALRSGVQVSSDLANQDDSRTRCGPQVRLASSVVQEPNCPSVGGMTRLCVSHSRPIFMSSRDLDI
jgi:hypothetical protein